GMGESMVEEKLKELTYSENPTLATYAKEDGIHVRISAKAENTVAAEAMVADFESKARSILGDLIYGVDDQSVPEAVMSLLDRCGLTLGTMEAPTAGQLSSSLAGGDPEGRRFLGGMVAYNRSLLETMGVDIALISDHGIVSEEVARAMATVARHTVHSDVGLSVVCGMEDGAEGGQRLGLVFCAVDDRGDVSASTTRYTTTWREVQRRSILDAIDLLRRRILAK
ncbi:MAG TPA: CinA family protein, partial [Chloroflexota bacterium]|nr:CinA family protein [Chloroflexota bacterium]